MRHSGPVSPTILKRHPLTGELIEPVGFLPNGKCVWPIMGAADDDDDDDDDGDDTSGGGTDDDKKGTKDDDDAGGGDDDKVSKADYDAVVRRMKAADKRASELEAEKKKDEDAKKDELQKAQDKVTELEQSVEDAQKTIKSLRLENAFLTANKHTWHNPDVAMKLAQDQGYIEDIIDEDGKVDKTALSKALDRLAKEHEYLVKKPEKQDDDEPDGPSGEPAGGRSGNGKDTAANNQKMRSRFPVLNR